MRSWGWFWEISYEERAVPRYRMCPLRVGRLPFGVLRVDPSALQVLVVLATFVFSFFGRVSLVL